MRVEYAMHHRLQSLHHRLRSFPSLVHHGTCPHAAPHSPRPSQATAPPPKLKRKMVYFLKLARVALVKEDVSKLVGAAGVALLWVGRCAARWVLGRHVPKARAP